MSKNLGEVKNCNSINHFLVLLLIYRRFKIRSSFLFLREKEKKQKKNLPLRKVPVEKLVIGDLIGDPTLARFANTSYGFLKVPTNACVSRLSLS